MRVHPVKRLSFSDRAHVGRPCGAMVARLTPDQKVACSNHVGVIWNMTILVHKNRHVKKSFAFPTIAESISHWVASIDILTNAVYSRPIYERLISCPYLCKCCVFISLKILSLNECVHWSPQGGSNSRPLVYKTSALTTELWRHAVQMKKQRRNQFLHKNNTKCDGNAKIIRIQYPLPSNQPSNHTNGQTSKRTNK